MKKTSNNKEFVRVLVISDLHCGHRLGLTPKAFQCYNNYDSKGWIAKLGNKAWGWFSEKIDQVKDEKNIDLLIVNGDAIDGKGGRNRGVELITTDMHEQGEMAEYIIDFIDAKKTVMTTGTPYHVGDSENFEYNIAKKLKKAGRDVSFDQEAFIKIFDTTIQARHKVGSSSIPHGRASAILREAMWNKILHPSDKYRSDIIIRSHIHYYGRFESGGKTGITTPALQINSNYGRSQCTGATDFGFIVIDIFRGNNYIITPYLLKIQEDPLYVKIPD